MLFHRQPYMTILESRSLTSGRVTRGDKDYAASSSCGQRLKQLDLDVLESFSEKTLARKLQCSVLIDIVTTDPGSRKAWQRLADQTTTGAVSADPLSSPTETKALVDSLDTLTRQAARLLTVLNPEMAQQTSLVARLLDCTQAQWLDTRNKLIDSNLWSNDNKPWFVPGRLENLLMTLRQDELEVYRESANECILSHADPRFWRPEIKDTGGESHCQFPT